VRQLENWFEGWDVQPPKRDPLRRGTEELTVWAVAPYYHPRIGGGEKQLRLLSEGLAARGHNVTVLTLRLPNTARGETICGVNVGRFGDSTTLDGRVQGYRDIRHHLASRACPGHILYVHLGVGAEYPTKTICSILAVSHSSSTP